VSIFPESAGKQHDEAKQINSKALMYNGKMRAGTAASLVEAYKQLQKRIKDVKARKSTSPDFFQVICRWMLTLQTNTASSLCGAWPVRLFDRLVGFNPMGSECL
jgi:hypothetical protein